MAYLKDLRRRGGKWSVTVCNTDTNETLATFTNKNRLVAQSNAMKYRGYLLEQQKNKAEPGG